MDEDRSEPRPWFEANKFFANELIPEANQWYEPGDKAFPEDEDLSATYSWAYRCANCLDALKEYSEFYNFCEFVDCYDEDLALTFNNYFKFIKIIVDVTMVQQEILDLQDGFKEITAQLAACRLVEIGGHNALSTLGARCYASFLEGLLDVQGRVSVHLRPAGGPILSTIASLLPLVVSSTPHLAPYYAGHAAANRYPNHGLDSQAVITLANSPEFREAVSQAHLKDAMPRSFDVIQGFDGQIILARIKAELSLLSQARKTRLTPSARIPLLPMSQEIASSDPHQDMPVEQASDHETDSRYGFELRGTNKMTSGIEAANKSTH